jgi:hypothetical protein
VLRRNSPKRLAFGNLDRLVFTGLYRLTPRILDALKILKPADDDPADIRQLIRDVIVREPALGRTVNPRRTAQAWHRCRADHRGKIHGEEKAATVAAGRPFCAIMPAALRTWICS